MPTEILEKYKQHIINLLVVFVFVFIAVQIYKDQVKKINVLAKQKQDQAVKNDLFDQIKQQESKSEEMISVINNKDLTMSLSVLSGLAKQSGVTITSLRPESQQTLQFYAKYIYQLSIEAASYHAIAKFISLLESHPYIFAIEQVSQVPTMDPVDGSLAKVLGLLRVSTVVVQIKTTDK